MMKHIPVRNNNRSFSKKRKREFSESPIYAFSGNLLQDEMPGEDEAIANIPDDNRIINGIKKLQKSNRIQSRKASTARLIIGLSEAAYLTDYSMELSAQLKEAFEIQSFIISPHTPGSVESYVEIRGGVHSISSAAVFISFILSAKVNNISKRTVFTLKSSDYRLTLLMSSSVRSKIQDIFETMALLNADTSGPYGFDGDLRFFLVHIQSDFNSLLNFLNIAFDVDSEHIQRDRNKHINVLGSFPDPSLSDMPLNTTDKNAASISRVLEFVYKKANKPSQDIGA